MMNNFDAFVAWEAKTQDTIDFKKAYVDIAEDLIAGLLLSQVIYWYLPDQLGKTKLRVEKKGHLWIAKGRDDWYDEIRISAKQFDRACGILIRKGIVIKDYFKFSGFRTVHIRLDKERYMTLWNEQMNPQGVRPMLTKGEDRSRPKGKTPIDQKGRPLTETTTKITDTPGRDFLQDFQDDVIASIGRHTDQEMLGDDTPSSLSASRVIAFGSGIGRPDSYKGCFCGALEISGDKPPCPHCEPQGVDEVETVFGPNPRQAQIDAYQPGELSREELVLAKLGSVDGSTRHYVKRIKDSGWNIRDEDVELGLAAFAIVTGFSLPTTKAQRKLWETGIREHLTEELFKGHLRILYDKVWDKIKSDVFESKLTITHPKAFTQWMYQEINAEARPTPLTRAQITSRLVDRGLVELREFDGDRVDYVWAATGQSVSEMSETFLKEQIG